MISSSEQNIINSIPCGTTGSSSTTKKTIVESLLPHQPISNFLIASHTRPGAARTQPISSHLTIELKNNSAETIQKILNFLLINCEYNSNGGHS